MFSLHVFFAFFSNFLIKLRRQFRVRKIFRTWVYAGFAVFSFGVWNYYFENAWLMLWVALSLKLAHYYGCSFVAKLSWKKVFFFWKIFLFFTKYTLLAEKNLFIWKKSFILNFFLLKITFLTEKNINEPHFRNIFLHRKCLCYCVTNKI